MSRFPYFLAATAAALSLPAHAGAEEQHEPACTAPAPLTGELASWAAPSPIEAAGNAKGLTAADLPMGQAADVKLLQTPDVQYPLPPEKPGGSVSYGGLVGVDIVDPGTYRVALGSGAWIDVVKDGKTVTSVKHGHGPACTGIRKMVDFPLQPGRYTLQVAANGTQRITMLVTRLP